MLLHSVDDKVLARFYMHSKLLHLNTQKVITDLIDTDIDFRLENDTTVKTAGHG